MQEMTLEEFGWGMAGEIIELLPDFYLAVLADGTYRAELHIDLVWHDCPAAATKLEAICLAGEYLAEVRAEQDDD